MNLLDVLGIAACVLMILIEAVWIGEALDERRSARHRS
jgi:hypothetical protein